MQANMCANNGKNTNNDEKQKKIQFLDLFH